MALRTIRITERGNIKFVEVSYQRLLGSYNRTIEKRERRSLGNRRCHFATSRSQSLFYIVHDKRKIKEAVLQGT